MSKLVFVAVEVLMVNSVKVKLPIRVYLVMPTLCSPALEMGTVSFTTAQ